MRIGLDDGSVLFPNGYSVDPGLTQDAFRSGEMFAHLRGQSRGAGSYIHHQIPGGEIEGHQLLVTLSFCDQMLLSVSMAVSLYPPDSKGWEGYSLDVEAETKRFHDRLLEQALGRPGKSKLLPNSFPAKQRTLAQPHTWSFPWGSVHSGHDIKGGGTDIVVRYAGRSEQADAACRSR